MFTRVLLNALVSALLFLAPCAARPAALLHPAPWLAFAMALTVLLSQPRLDVREATAARSADRGSALGIFAAMMFTPLVATLEFVRSGAAHATMLFYAGATLALAGLALRLWAIATLGRFFTSTVHVAEGQRVVESGPYRWLRHPSYTGALLAVFGTCVSLGSAWGVLLVAAVCVPAYMHRIRAEERALLTQLGAAYALYRMRTGALLPGLGRARHARVPVEF